MTKTSWLLGAAILGVMIGTASSCTLGDYTPPGAGSGGGGNAGNGGNAGGDTVSAASGGGSGGDGGSGGVAGNGGNGGNSGDCVGPNDCMANVVLAECETVACVNGQCIVKPVTDPLGDNRRPLATGDCSDHACENGKLVKRANPNDPPTDNNGCTVDSCSSTVPVYTPVFGGKCDYLVPGGLQLGTCVSENGGQTAVCAQCSGEAASCPVGMKCRSNLCVDGTFCGDGMKNSSETDVDCGGLGCIPCDVGGGCGNHSDCWSGSCVNLKCVQPTCQDLRKNGNETGVDCGGTICPKCPKGEHCSTGEDCNSGVCQNGICQARSCLDGVMNGGEGGIDCGGDCPYPCD